MGGEARIVPLKPDGIGALVSLAREIWHVHYPAMISVDQIEYMLAQRYSPEVIREELRRSDIWWDTLLEDGRLAGFSCYFLTGEPGEMKLDKLYVDTAGQRRGHGARLVARAAGVAASRGCDRLVLTVNKRNMNAIAAYRKYGFEVVDAVVKEIGGGFVMDDYVMALRLAR